MGVRLGGWMAPESAALQHGNKDSQRLAHEDGRVRRLRFTGGQEMLVEISDDLIEAAGSGRPRTRHIEPASLPDNGRVESLNGRSRDQPLDPQVSTHRLRRQMPTGQYRQS